jgi:CheY-like chemotaxis protein
VKEKTILIVDDEFFIVNALSVKFRNSNYAVATARNGREALESIRETKPDLVITDYQMPYLNGMELVEAIRSDESTSDIPIIMLTARGQSLLEEGNLSFGVNAFMSKPFSPKEMVRKAASLIGEP